MLAAAVGATPVKRTLGDHQVVLMSRATALEMARRLPGLLIEEDQPLRLFAMPQLPARAPARDFRHALKVSVHDAASGAALPNVTLFGIGAALSYRADSGADGTAVLEADEPELQQLIVSPRQGHWSRVLWRVPVQGGLRVRLQRLTPSGGHSWGHRVMGFHRVAHRFAGAGLRVAVIDSGVSDAVAELRVAGGLNTLDGQAAADWRIDAKGHGTHCAGVIAARGNARGVLGGAPKADLFALKVLPGGYVSDLVEAIEWCIAQRIDVMSMSLGSDAPSAVLESALQQACLRGLTCIAAAGNDATRVAYPAAFASVIAVAAIGRFGSFPPDSAHALRVGRATDVRGELFAAGFSNWGPEIAVCAPGVAVLSTVPTGYAVWDGTSMACPMVAALAALVLEANPWARSGDAAQPEFVRAALTASAAPLGMPAALQGAGLPLAPSALRLA